MKGNIAVKVAGFLLWERDVLVPCAVWWQELNILSAFSMTFHFELNVPVVMVQVNGQLPW